MSAANNRTRKKERTPSVSFKEEVAGRGTLTAIAEDRLIESERLARAQTSTTHYGDRISNAPGAVSPKSARALDGTPDIAVTYREVGPQTYAAISDQASPPRDSQSPEIEITPSVELSREAEIAALNELIAALKIEKIYTFVAKGDPKQFAELHARRSLVEKRLLHHTAAGHMDDITKIEILSGARPGYFTVKIWALVG